MHYSNAREELHTAVPLMSEPPDSSMLDPDELRFMFNLACERSGSTMISLQLEVCSEDPVGLIGQPRPPLALPNMVSQPMGQVLALGPQEQAQKPCWPPVLNGRQGVPTGVCTAEFPDWLGPLMYGSGP